MKLVRKNKGIERIILELKRIAVAADAAAEELKTMCGITESPQKKSELARDAPEGKTEDKAEKAAKLTLEEVRAVLTAKSRQGHTEAIRQMLKSSYGVDRLSLLDPKHYNEIVDKAKEL